MKIAVSFQNGLSMIEFTIRVVQFSPWQKLHSGCSLTSYRGVIHVTGASRPSSMSATTLSSGKMWRSQTSGCIRTRSIAENADHT